MWRVFHPHRFLCRDVLFSGDMWSIGMRITPKDEIRKGFWFARKIDREKDWGIAVIWGQFPFLAGRIVAYASDLDLDQNRFWQREFEISNPAEWEFGERILFPE